MLGYRPATGAITSRFVPIAAVTTATASPPAITTAPTAIRVFSGVGCSRRALGNQWNIGVDRGACFLLRLAWMGLPPAKRTKGAGLGVSAEEVGRMAGRASGQLVRRWRGRGR